MRCTTNVFEEFFVLTFDLHRPPAQTYNRYGRVPAEGSIFLFGCRFAVGYPIAYFFRRGVTARGRRCEAGILGDLSSSTALDLTQCTATTQRNALQLDVLVHGFVIFACALQLCRDSSLLHGFWKTDSEAIFQRPVLPSSDTLFILI